MSVFQSHHDIYTTGPYAPYVIETRTAGAVPVTIVRASQPNGYLGESLSEIAAACGFSSQRHVTDVFCAKLGVTPGRYRNEVR